MNASKVLSVAAVALVVFSGSAFSQNKAAAPTKAPAEAGAKPAAIPKGQPRPMTVAYAKQIVTAAVKVRQPKRRGGR